MDAVKVVVLGGSGVATPEFVNAWIEARPRTKPVELVLVGRSLEKLSQVARVAQLFAGADPLLSISFQTDLQAALDGADYVLNQIRVGGLEARIYDESFPQAFGLPGEETVGPGGFANAVRTIPAVLKYAQLIEAVCPHALILNFANPSSLVQYAITRYTNARVIGLCDGPVTLCESIARVLDAKREELVIDYVGMHHFGWVVGIWRSGDDVLPQALQKTAQISPEVDQAISQAIGAVPGPYLNYVFHPDRMLAKKMGKPPRATELLALQSELLAEYDNSLANGQKPVGLERRKARWYRAIVVPVLFSLIENHSTQFILNVRNDTAISWLPEQAIVELPVFLTNGLAQPLAVGAVPSAIRALVQANCAYEMLAVEAIVERDRRKALQALLLNPIIHTYDQAAKTIDCAWETILDSIDTNGKKT